MTTVNGNSGVFRVPEDGWEKKSQELQEKEEQQKAASLWDLASDDETFDKGDIKIQDQTLLARAYQACSNYVGKKFDVVKEVVAEIIGRLALDYVKGKEPDETKSDTTVATRIYIDENTEESLGMVSTRDKNNALVKEGERALEYFKEHGSLDGFALNDELMAQGYTFKVVQAEHLFDDSSNDPKNTYKTILEDGEYKNVKVEVRVSDGTGIELVYSRPKENGYDEYHITVQDRDSAGAVKEITEYTTEQ